jgi:hypothetical protein
MVASFLGYSRISHKSAGDGTMSDTDLRASRVLLSPQCLVGHVFPARQQNVPLYVVLLLVVYENNYRVW